MKRMTLIISLILMVGFASGCATNNKQDLKSINISGSAILQPLVQEVANLYNMTNQDIKISIQSGGSQEGFKRLLAGTDNMASSDVKAEDLISVADAGTLVGKEICLNGVAVIIDTKFTAEMSGITQQQLVDIFTGKITNWKDVGGPDLAIAVINRPAQSSIRTLFEKWGTGGVKTIDGNTSLQTDDYMTIIKNINATKGSIAYLEIPYLIDNTGKVASLYIDNVDPSLENIYNGSYKIWGYEYVYTKKDASEQVNRFVSYLKADQVEGKIEEMNYGVIRKLSAKALKERQ
ncbi:MAG: substrate-binding domain-containing protein [Clostridia bacterium]